jgi:hypothetical protein
MTGRMIAGKAEVGAIVCTPPSPMLKAMLFWSGVVFESRIACRSDPAPLSSVLVTMNVESSSRSSSGSMRGRNLRVGHFLMSLASGRYCRMENSLLLCSLEG